MGARIRMADGAVGKRSRRLPDPIQSGSVDTSVQAMVRGVPPELLHVIVPDATRWECVCLRCRARSRELTTKDEALGWRRRHACDWVALQCRVQFTGGSVGRFFEYVGK